MCSRRRGWGAGGPTSRPYRDRPARKSKGGHLDVLIVEDDPVVRLTYAKALVQAGFAVRTAENGLVALGVLSTPGQAPRVVVCDIHMPILDGIGLYRRLRNHSPQLAERFLFLTGSVPEQAPVLVALGRPYLAKPVDLPELVRTVRRMSETGGERRTSEERRRGVEPATVSVERRGGEERRHLPRRTGTG